MTSFISLKLSKDPVVKEALACQLECQDMFEKLSQTPSITALENVRNLPSGWRFAG